MIARKKRFVILASLMVLLVGAMAAFSTRLLYNTALNEQEKRLSELVQSQAALVSEMGWLALQLQISGGPKVSQHVILHHLSHSHKQFMLGSDSGEFVVAERRGDGIRMLLMDDHGTDENHWSPAIPLDSPLTEPAKLALEGKTGTIVARDYKGNTVLAAYSPLKLGTAPLGLVAKIDIDEIRTPFIEANFKIMAMGITLTVICLMIFFKISEPIIRDMQISERKYRDLVEGLNVIIIRVNRRGVITFANGFAESLFGHDDDSVTGKRFSSFIMELPDALSLEELVERVGEKHFGTEVPVSKADGNIGWVSWTTKPIYEQGELIELLCIGNDVTRTHLVNESQKEIEERFRGIAKASPVGIVITDPTGNLTYANERMHTLTKTSATDLVGRGWFERIHPEDKPELQQQWFGTRPGNRGRREFRLISKDGDALWVLGQIVALTNSKDEIYGDIITFTDITPTKEAELAQRRLTAAINQAAEMIIITDLDARITYVNPAFEETTGHSRLSVLGKKTNILKSGEQDEAFYRDLWDTIGHGKIWKGRFINKHKNGRRYTQESTIAPIRDDSGKNIGYVSVSRDISDQLVVEAQLRQSQKLESIGELAAGIAHEINTPTQYVTSNLQFLEEAFITYANMLEGARAFLEKLKSKEYDCVDDVLRRAVSDVLDDKELEYLSEDVPNALTESAEGLKRITNIVQSVKQLAHPGEVRKSFHDLNTIVRDAATVSTNEWKYMADVVYELDESMPRINCLKGEIGQVVLNLIVNGAHAIDAARKAPEDRGTITLKTYEDEGYAVLEVSDTGTGIPKEIVGKIFDPFFTTKEVGKGTGQGLAITYNAIVNMHQGKVDVVTQEGKGSTFIVKLPLEADGTEEPEDEA
ncbi:PAS domain S-box protein [Pseudodesulfovibrio cashew]|uniref:histidine kinase n=1 Tax=Pseudodesulfovibrio cashew TaxID=2678688 RepID=A0A6I6JC04_9BACT|nr:PAS domain S-box protein [Pseudodesulfovibrio cashew]QGY38659.1 PAS domain S-box protein [Pseudodesulfovibrio cashew]